MERDFQIIEGFDWPADVCRAWRELTDRNPDASFAQTYHWNRACVEHLGFRSEPFFLVVARLGTQVEAIFPFTIGMERLFGFKIKVLHLPKHLHIELHDVALRAGGDHRRLIADLFHFLKSNGKHGCDVIELGRVLENSAARDLLRSGTGSRATLIPRRVCNYLSVMSEDQLFRHVSRNMRSNFRKARKALDGHVRVRYLTSRNPDDLPELYERFLQVEASGWKGAEGTGTAILLDAQLAAFYRQLLDSFGEDGRCEINLLQIDGEVAAAQFAVIGGRVLYLLKIGYNQDFAEVAPGQLLLAHTVSRLHAEGDIKTINLITDTAWHNRWRPTELTVYEAMCYADSLRGTLAYAQKRLRTRLGRWRRSLKIPAKHDGA